MSVSVFTYGTFVAATTGPSGVVTLSGESVVDLATSNRLCRAAIVIQTDGTVDSIQNTTQAQIDSGTDWIIPNGDASSLHEVKYDLDSGDTLDGATSLADGVYGFISTNRFFEQRWAAGLGVGGNTSGITLSIRYNGGAVLDTATYSLQAERIF